jgi:hypothetical protein
MAATSESEAAEADQSVGTIAYTVPAVLTSAPPFSQLISNASDVPTAAPTSATVDPKDGAAKERETSPA